MKSGMLTIYSSAKKYGLPYTNLHGRVRGAFTKEPERPPKFTAIEEKPAEDWVLNCASLGVPANKPLRNHLTSGIR